MLPFPAQCSHAMLNVANQKGEWPSHAYGIVMDVIDVSRKINLILDLVFPIPPLHQPAGNACVLSSREVGHHFIQHNLPR